MGAQVHAVRADVRPADVARAQPHQPSIGGLEVRGPRRGRQFVGVRHSEHGSGFAGRERLQAYPVGQMSLQTPQPTLVQTLAGQQQVHSQRPAEAPDRHEEFRELRTLAEQLGELVDDDEQHRQRGQIGARRAGPTVLRDAPEISCRPQDLLPAVHFAGERLVHPVDQVGLIVEVGDDRRHVGEPLETQKRGATLEIDEGQIEIVGRMRGHQAENQRPQDLRFARSGGPDAQPVRTHTVFGGLLEVQFHRVAPIVRTVADADRNPQPLRVRAPLPSPHRVPLAGVRDTDQIRPAGTAGVGAATGAPPGQPACAHPCLRSRQAVHPVEVGEVDHGVCVTGEVEHGDAGALRPGPNPVGDHHRVRGPAGAGSRYMMRQPFQPVPLRAGRTRHTHRTGAVPHRQLAHDGANQCGHGGRFAGEADMPGDVDRDGQACHHRAGRDQPVQRRGGHRVGLGHRVRDRDHQLGRRRHRAQAQPDMAEVGIRRCALPHPSAAGQSPQQHRIRVPAVLPNMLRACGFLGLGGDTVQVAQVVAAAGVQLGGPPTAGVGERAEHRRRHQHREDQVHRVACRRDPRPRCQVQHRHTADRDERQHRQQARQRPGRLGHRHGRWPPYMYLRARHGREPRTSVAR